MRKYSILTIICLLAITSCKDPQATFDKLSSEVKKEFAPDRRSSIYDIKLEENGKELILRGLTTEQGAKDALLKGLDSLGVSILDSVTVIDSTCEDNYALATLSVNNLRYSPNYSAEMATQVLMGAPLRTFQKDGNWIKVQTPEGYFGWVTSKSVKPITKEEYEKWKASKRLVVTKHYTLFRAEPREDADVVCDGVWGDIVNRYDTQATKDWENFGLSLVSGVGKYYRVMLPGGEVAYVLKSDVKDFDTWLDGMKTYVTKDSPVKDIEAAQDAIIATAKQFLGFPYLWAGTSIKALDCSGFSKTTYQLNGIQLLRDASQQAKTGEHVDIENGWENLQKGDLLFFGRKASEGKSERITHVGIYIEDGVFIHSASVVRINSLDPESDIYYSGSKNLVRARRILTNHDITPEITTLKHGGLYK